MNITEIPNELIASNLRDLLLHDTEVRMSLRSFASGSFDIFIRNHTIQKFSFPQFQLNSEKTAHFLSDDELSEDDSWDGVEIPQLVYRRFCHLVSDAITTFAPVDYGTLRFEFSFNDKGNEEWVESFTITYLKEIHLDDGGKRRR